MNNDILLENLILALRSRIPPRMNLATVLSEKLNVGKEAIYRRLRGEVPFSFNEVVSLTRSYNISLDFLTGSSLENIAVFSLVKMKFLETNKIDYNILETALEWLKTVASEARSELAMASNTIPLSILIEFPALTQFYIFKWIHRHEKSDQMISYATTEMPSRLYEILQEAATYFRTINKSTHIWDHSMIRYTTEDIEYFQKINLITPNEVARIKSELHSLLDDIQEITARGGFVDGNKVDVYISNTFFDTSYGYITTDRHHFSMIRAFVLNIISSNDPQVLDELSEWMASHKHQATLISGTGEMERVTFIRRQRDIVDSL